MGSSRNGVLNANHMKDKRLKKARKGEPYWGLVKTPKAKNCPQEVYVLEKAFVEFIQSLDPKEVLKTLGINHESASMTSHVMSRAFFLPLWREIFIPKKRN